jgi:hypothetical protein
MGFHQYSEVDCFFFFCKMGIKSTVMFPIACSQTVLLFDALIYVFEKTISEST